MRTSTWQSATMTRQRSVLSGWRRNMELFRTSSRPSSCSMRLRIMNHCCRRGAGGPSVTVRPDMFGFVQAGRPTPNSSIRDAADSSVLSCGAAPVEWSRCRIFFCLFVFPALSEVPSSQPLISILSLVERSGGNRGGDVRPVM